MAGYLLGYILIQVSILLFMAPFYFWYRTIVRNVHKTKSTLSDQIEAFFTSKQANYLVFAWAFSEAIVWFVIPEFLLILMVYMRIQRKRQLVTYDIAGTALGAVVAYYLGAAHHSALGIPFITSRMIAQVDTWYSSSGLLGLLHQPFSGVPFKVFNFEASHFSLTLIVYVIAALVIRMLRYVVAYGFCVATYPALHKYVHKHYVRLFFATTFIFSILLVRVYSSYR